MWLVERYVVTNFSTSTPSRQYATVEEVLPKMRSETEYYLTRTSFQILLLAMMGGVFVTFGALFSLLLADGVTTAGPGLLLGGLGFSVGFFMIILSRAALFTEANVMLPATALQSDKIRLPTGAWRFWAVAWIGNMLGAFLIGQVIAFAQIYPDSTYVLLGKTVAKKMVYLNEGGTVIDWLRIVVSGMMGNGMIGIAAFFAIMANTVVGKFIPIFLVVSLFVAANLQHSPANMAYFSLYSAYGGDGNWAELFLWNIIPAGIGNILGGIVLVALPFWYAFRNLTSGD
jgi:formate transporter